jgi:hypothetical protein
MKACSAVFGIVAGLFAVASPVFNSGRCNAAEGAANSESISGRSAPTASWGHVNGEDANHLPEARLFDGLTEWEYRNDEGIPLSCDHLGEEESKLFRVFEIYTFRPAPEGDGEVWLLAKKVKKVLDAGGWRKCKAIYGGDGTYTDTYSKDKRLLQVFSAYSNGVGGRLTISIAEGEIEPVSPRRR